MNKNIDPKSKSIKRIARMTADEYSGFTDEELIRAFELNVPVFTFTVRSAIIMIFRYLGINPDRVRASLVRGEYNFDSGLMFANLGTKDTKVVEVWRDIGKRHHHADQAGVK